MAYNTPRTLVNRGGVTYDAAKTSVIFAEDMNKLKDNDAYLKDRVDTLDKCRAYASGAYNIPNASDTILALNQEGFDTNTMHDVTTNNSRVTIKKAGYYAVSGYVVYDSSAVGLRSTQIYKNGAGLLLYSSNAPTAGQSQVPLAGFFYLAVNDYLQLNVYQNSGAPLARIAAEITVIQLM